MTMTDMEENSSDIIEDVGLLSKRNLKRFGRLTNVLESKIRNVQNQNQTLKEESEKLKQEIEELEKKKIEEKINIIKNKTETELAYEKYQQAKKESERTKSYLSPYSSSLSNYGTEIIWFSVVIGLVFDFLLWKDIFEGKFGTDIWAERAERASAIIMAFSYAYVCSRLGVSFAVKALVSKRKKDEKTNYKEIEIYKKSTAKETFWGNMGLFLMLSVLATLARFTEDHLELADKAILSLAAVSIGLVIAAIGYWYHDVYEYFIRAAKNEELKTKKIYEKTKKKEKK